MGHEFTPGAKCATEGCAETQHGKSKYCRACARVARAKWIEMISAKAAEKDAREKQWADLYAAAQKAGMEAGQVHVPTPMVVVGHANPLDDSSPAVQRWDVPDGACGFAWVTIRPGTHSFAKWLVKHGHGSAAYQGGVQVWVHEHNQSIERKERHASAFAKVLRAAGIDAYSASRMD